MVRSARTRRPAAATAVAMILGSSPALADCSYDTPMLASVCTTVASFCPARYLDADGRLLAIKDNQALFTLLGTTYGGDGVTTFALPDLHAQPSAKPHDQQKLHKCIAVTAVFPARD